MVRYHPKVAIADEADRLSQALNRLFASAIEPNVAAPAYDAACSVEIEGCEGSYTNDLVDTA